MAQSYGDTSSLKHEELELSPPKDRLSEVVSEIVRDSRGQLSQVREAHEEALANSLAAGPHDTWPTSGPAARPYGGRSYAGADTNRIYGNITSPFTLEQVNSIVTAMVEPYLSQRELVYIEPHGKEDIRPARVRERLFEQTIRGPMSCFAPLMWMTARDQVVHSRSFIEPRYVKYVRSRRTYQYMSAEESAILLAAGGATPEEAMAAGTLRMSAVEKTTVWEGPMLFHMPFGSVHKPSPDPFLTDLSAYKVTERRAPFQSFLAMAEKMFGPTAENVDVPYDEAACREAAQNSHDGVEDRYYSDGARPTRDLPSVYEPVHWLEMKGQDPLGDPENDLVVWICGGVCIGAKLWDGSGTPIDNVEFVWDPISGMSTSVSPAIALRPLQEMLTLLQTARLGKTLWSSFPAGIVDPLVASADVMSKLRPGRYVEGKAGGQAVQWVQSGRGAGEINDLVDRVENQGRNATAGQGSVVGMPPPGVGSAHEFVGVSQGSMSRLAVQGKLNADCGWARIFRIQHSQWRDNLPTDSALVEKIGVNEDTSGANLADLEGEMPVTILDTSHQVINERELGAIERVFGLAQRDPAWRARLLSGPMFDDAVQAAAGPRGWRWAKTMAQLAQEMLAQGMTPETLDQQATVMVAQGGPAKGTPSAPAPPAPSIAQGNF